MTDDCEVVAVVVTLSETARLHTAIDSVQRNLEQVDHKVVVVHNSPGATTTEERNGVRWVGAGMNLGWAAGMHAGLLGTRSRYVWAIQDDLQMHRSAYGLLTAALDADPDLASVRPLPADDRGMTHPGFAGAGVASDGHFTGGLPPQPIPADEYDAGTVGAFLPSSGQLVRRDVWEAVGGFDPWIYPWGYIDVDFGRTLTHTGHTFRIVPEARMRHEVGTSTNHAFREYLSGRNKWLFAEKWRNPEPDLSRPRADPAILAEMRAGRARPRSMDLSDLQKVAGVAAADCMLHLGRTLPGLLEPLAAERDALRTELDAVSDSRAWRAVERFRRLRRRVTGQ